MSAQMKKISFRNFVLFLLAPFLICFLYVSLWAATGEKNIHLFFTGDLTGYLKPCG